MSFAPIGLTIWGTVNFITKGGTCVASVGSWHETWGNLAGLAESPSDSDVGGTGLNFGRVTRLYWQERAMGKSVYIHMCNIYRYYLYIFLLGGIRTHIRKNICISRYHVAHLHHLTFSWSRWDGLWEGPGHNVASVARQTQVTDAREDSIQFAGNLKFCGQKCCRDFIRLSEKLPSITYVIAWTPQSNVTSCCFNKCVDFRRMFWAMTWNIFRWGVLFTENPGNLAKSIPELRSSHFFSSYFIIHLYMIAFWKY